MVGYAPRAGEMAAEIGRAANEHAIAAWALPGDKICAPNTGRPALGVHILIGEVLIQEKLHIYGFFFETIIFVESSCVLIACIHL